MVSLYLSVNRTLPNRVILGDVVYANVAGTHMIIINSVETASELLEDRGSNYSDRMSQYFIAELVGWKDGMLYLNDGPEFREHRRLFARTIGSKATLEEFEPMIRLRTRHFLRQLLSASTPNDLPRHVRG
jgi:cytochrome P450